MADTFPNPYSDQSPIGAALAGLSKIIMTGPSEGKRIAEAEAALRLKDNREGRYSASDMLRNFGTPGFDRTGAAAALLRGGLNPETYLGGTERYLTANQYGVADPRTTNAFVGAGGAMSGSPGGFAVDQSNAMTRHQMSLNENARQFDQKPTAIDTGQGPMFVTQQNAIGQAAPEGSDKVKGSLARRAMNSPGGIGALPQAEQRFVGAESKAENRPELYNATLADGSNVPAAWGPNGLVHAETGQKLTGVKSVGKLVAQKADDLNSGAQSTVYNSRVNTDTAVSAIDRLDRALAAPDADQSVGLIGRGASIFNDVRAQVSAATRLAGGTTFEQEAPALAQSAASAAKNILNNPQLAQRAQQLGVSHAILQSQIMDLAYMVAKAQDASGKLSNSDIENAARTIGGSLMDPAAGRRVLADLRERLVAGQEIRERHAKGVWGTAVPAAPAPVAPGPPAPADPGASPSRERWVRGPNGQMMRAP